MQFLRATHRLMEDNLGLIYAETANVKEVLGSFVKQSLAFQKPAVDLQKARAQTITALLTDAEKPKFQSWRDAQLLGEQLPARGPRGAGPPVGFGPPVQSGHIPQTPDGPQSMTIGLGRPAGGQGHGIDPSSPLKDADLPTILKVTLNAEHAAVRDAPIKGIRLGDNGEIPQSAAVTGGNYSRQLVFNAHTDRAVSGTEPGYSPVGFPFGWQAHQLSNEMHRGGILKLSGRLIDLLSGIALLSLRVRYRIDLDLWNRGKPTQVGV